MRSSRWDESHENRKKSVTHSMIICDKSPVASRPVMLCPPIDDSFLYSNGAVTDEELQELHRRQKEVNLCLAS